MGWEVIMLKATATLVLTPPSFDLWFDGLHDDFPRVLSGLKLHCPWMRWDRKRRVWSGHSCKVAPTLAFCRTIFPHDQIVVLWAKPSTGEELRQLRMF